MKRLLFGLLMVVVLAGAAYAVEETIGNFDSGADPVTMGGATFPFNSSDPSDWANALYDSGSYLGPTGQSLRIQWGGVSAADRYAGGGLFFVDATPLDTTYETKDASAYNCISFWVIAGNAASNNAEMEIQLKDYSGGAEHAAKVKLSDYVKTSSTTWKQVIIPFEAFRRNLSTIDFTKARALVFSADYTNGLECIAAGDLYIDDVKFSYQHHAPNRTVIYSGADKGTANIDDIAGDTLLWWTQAASTITTNEVTVNVSSCNAVSWVTTPSLTNNVAANATFYYGFSVRNDGNMGDRIVFSTQTINGTQPWKVTLFWDKDKNGSFSAGDVECWDSIGLLPDSTHYFLAAVAVPSGAVNNSSTTVRVIARDNFGGGADDDWPSASINDDTIISTFSAVCLTPTLTVVKSTSTATGKPAGTVTYTITVVNNGSANATNVALTDVIPLNMLLSGTASGTGTPTVTYYNGSSWSGSTTSATKVRWVWASIASGGGSASATFTAQIK